MTRKLEIRMLNYFTLIVMAASIISIEFFIEISDPEFSSSVCYLVSDDTIFTSSSALNNLRNKIVIMFGILTIVVAIIMMMFIKNIALPLKKMAASANKINNGDLTEIIHIENQDEIGLVGTAINELTSNLQEVAALTHATVGQALNSIDNIKDKSENNTVPSADEIEELRDQVSTLNSFIESFTLLQTDINK